ncbi:uncharacterized protein DS421_20g696010 [Arachis hypogaea]|nr:uncharacterized protein DS421_20g696010 [Arachis hypogaea]
MMRVRTTPQRLQRQVRSTEKSGRPVVRWVELTRFIRRRWFLPRTLRGPRVWRRRLWRRILVLTKS